MGGHLDLAGYHNNRSEPILLGLVRDSYPGIVFETSVIDLGVVIDEEVKMDVHVGRITRSCFYQLRQIRTIRQFLSDNATRTLIHSFVVTRVDYCNSVLSGITAVQNRMSSENFECSGSSRASNSEVRTGIGVDQRQSALASSCTSNKIQDHAILVANCINQRAPLYLQEHCVLVTAVSGRRHLRSADQLCLVVNRCRLSSMQKRGFAVAGPMA